MEGLAELHTHLGGSVASDILWSLVHEQGIALPVKIDAVDLAEQVLDLLAHWSDYRIEAEELEDLGEDSVLAVGRQRGTGKLSGAEVDYPIFIVWKFRENEIVGVYFEGTRGAALEAAELAE